MNIITGRTGQPHVTSQQQRDIFTSIFSSANYVLNVGKKLEAVQIDANTVRIHDGQLIMNGCIASIESGEYEDLAIENGNIGYERIDYVTAHYIRTIDADNNSIESVRIEIEKSDVSMPIVDGVSSTPQPYVNNLSIREGANDYYFRLYAVCIKNLNIESIIPMYEIFNESPKWMAVTYSSFFKDYSDGQKLQYRKSGDLIEIRGSATPVINLPIDDYNTLYTIGTVPITCAPSSAVRLLCQGSGAAVWELTIASNGEITVSRYRTGTVLEDLKPNIWLPMQATYLLG